MPRACALIVALSVATLTLMAQTPSRDAPTPSQSAAATATIRGRVLIAGTDVPVRKARVTLSPDTGGLGEPIYADNDGRFEFPRVKPGRHIVSAWKTGYVETRFGARRFWDSAVSIVVAAGQVVDQLDVTLERAAAISGRVIDDLGEPLTGMTVTVGRVIARDGKARLESSIFTAETDDLGEYRVGGLPPGSFVVATFGFTPPSPTTMTTPDGRTTTAMIRRPHTVCHPDAPLIMQARPITLNGGQEAASVDVTFGSEIPTARVSGRIVDPQGRTTSFVLSVVSDGNGIPAAGMGLNIGVPQSGDFTVAVSPGEYALVAQSESGVAIQHVSVGPSDLSGIQLVLAKGARISGRVLFEGKAPPPSARVFVEASSPEALGGAAMMQGAARIGQPAVVSPGGTFTLTGVVGRRELSVNAQSLPGWSLESITASGRNLLDLPVDFKGDEDLRDVVIVFADQKTRLTGAVTDARDRPVIGVSVIVFADDRRLLPRRARWLRADTTGRFAIEGLPAGDYLVAVADDVDDLQWSTAAYLDRFRAQATRVTLADRESTPLALRWRTPR